MRLMIIRHGDPDYSIDSLTPKGWREAKLLADRLCRMDIKKFSLLKNIFIFATFLNRDTQINRNSEILCALVMFPYGK